MFVFGEKPRGGASKLKLSRVACLETETLESLLRGVALGLRGIAGRDSNHGDSGGRDSKNSRVFCECSRRIGPCRCAST